METISKKAKKTEIDKKPVAYHKRLWNAEEDMKIMECIDKYGTNNWQMISKHIPGRTGKQCRERFVNNLSPDLKQGKWTKEEDRILLENYKLIGNKWSSIAAMIPGRSANGTKNRFKSLSHKKPKRHLQCSSIDIIKKKKTTETPKLQFLSIESLLNNIPMDLEMMSNSPKLFIKPC